MIPTSKITYYRVNKEVAKKFPGTREYKKVWCVNENYDVYEDGTIIGAVTKDDKIVYYDEFENFIKNQVIISERKEKLSKIYESRR